MKDGKGEAVESANATGTSINKAKQMAADLLFKQTKLEMPDIEQLKARRIGFILLYRHQSICKININFLFELNS